MAFASSNCAVAGPKPRCKSRRVILSDILLCQKEKMGKCISKQREKVKSFDNPPLYINTVNGTVNIFVGKEEEKRTKKQIRIGLHKIAVESGEFGSEDDGVEEECKPPDTGQNVLKQQHETCQITKSACSKFVKESSCQELSTFYTVASEDDHYDEDNEKFEILRNEPFENALHRISDEMTMTPLKDPSENDSNCNKLTGHPRSPSDSFKNDICNNVHFAQEGIMHRVHSEKEVDCPYRENNAKRLDREKDKRCHSRQSLENCVSGKGETSRSGIGFSILSEERPFYPAEGEENVQTQVNEDLNTYRYPCHSSTEVKYDHERDNEFDSTSLLQSQRKLDISFSRSVTGYPNETRPNTSIGAFSSQLSSFMSISSFTSRANTDACRGGTPVVDFGSSLRVQTGIRTKESQHTTQSSYFMLDNMQNPTNPTTEKVDKVSVACQTSVEGAEGNDFGQTQRESLSSLSDKLVSLSNDASSSYFSDSGVGSYADSLENSKSKGHNNDTSVEKDNEHAEESDFQNNEDQDHRYCNSLNELTEATETNTCEGSITTVLKRITDMEKHVTITLFDISFFMYIDMKSLKALVCMSLNHIQVLVAEGTCLEFTADNGETMCLKRSGNGIHKAIGTKTTLNFTDKYESNEISKNEIQNIVQMLPTFRDSECEPWGTVMPDSIEEHQNDKFITSRLRNVSNHDKWGHTRILNENEELEKNRKAAKEHGSQSQKELTSKLILDRSDLSDIKKISDRFDMPLRNSDLGDGSCYLACFDVSENGRDARQTENNVISQSKTHKQSESKINDKCWKEERRHKNKMRSNWTQKDLQKKRRLEETKDSNISSNFKDSSDSNIGRLSYTTCRDEGNRKIDTSRRCGGKRRKKVIKGSDLQNRRRIKVSKEDSHISTLLEDPSDSNIERLSYTTCRDEGNGKIDTSRRLSDRKRRKKRIKGSLKNSSTLNISEESFSDSILKDVGCTHGTERSTCFFCKRSLDVPNKKCKRHKKIGNLKPEGKQLARPEVSSSLSNIGISKRFSVSKVESYDSGIASELDSSCLQSWCHFKEAKSERKINFLLKRKNNGKSSLRKLVSKQNKIGQFLYQGRIPFSTFRHSTRNVFARERERQIAKTVAREIHVDHRNIPVFGLGSYFDRLNNGPPPTTQERMQYEWLRLSTFHNYTGNGNALALARNGFYHDHTEGPSSTRCYLCNAYNSDWEMFDDVSEGHRRQSPNCPFHANSEQESINVSIASGDSDGSSAQSRTSAATSTPVDSTVTVTAVSSNAEAAVNEATRSLQRTELGQDQASSSGGESVSQQPTEDPESRDRSLLALSQPRTQRALGRTGHSYSTIIAPRKNNVATGARSNVGLETSGSSSSTSNTTSQLPGIRLSSILAGPVGAGAFNAGNLNLSGQNAEARTPVSTATEALQGNSAAPPAAAPTSGTEQAASGSGPGGRADTTSTVVINNPKHPDYLNIDARINSYVAWPDYLDQTPRQMSEAGFFFVGVADFTRCFCCGGGLRNWEPGDDPMLEHTRWFPRCEYVNKLKGERYVAAVQRRHQEHMAEQQRQQIELAQRRDENRNPQDPMTTDAAAVMREMGYSVDRTREAILAVRQQTGSSVVTTQQVLTWLLDDEDRRTNGNTGSRPTTSTSVPSSVINTSVPSSIIYTGSSIASSLVHTGTSIATSIVNATSSISSATSIVSAGTTTSTVSSTSTETTAKVQQTVTSTTAQTGNQQTEASQAGTITGAMSNSSSSSGGGSVEKQSGASGGDSDESKSTATEGASSSAPTGKSTKKKNAKKKAKSKAGTKSETAGATGEGIDAKSLKAENEKLREMQTCKICMERPVNTTLLPCGHLVCCESCASRLQRCPICRKRIKGTVKTFMS